MEEYKLFVQRIGLIGITQLLVSLSGIILLPILTKNLPIEEYGIWILINVTVGLIPIVVMFGLPFTMVRFLASSKKKEDIQEGFYSIFFIGLFTSAIASLLIFLLSKLIAASLFNNNLAIVKTLSLIVFIECLNLLFLNFFRTFQQIKRSSIFLFMKTGLTLVLISYFVLSGYGIFGAVIGFLITEVVVFLIMAFIIISEIGIKIPKFTNVRVYLKFGIPLVPSSLSSWVVNTSDCYIIGVFLGAAFVGYYSPGYALGSIINMFIAPISFMLPVILSKYYDENNMKGIKHILRYSLKYFLAIAIPSAFGLSLLSKPLLEILSTHEIASQGYIITPFITISMVLLGTYGIIVNILVLKKKTKIIGETWITAGMLNFGLNLIFIPYMGIFGAAITTLIAYVYVFIITIYYSFKYFTFDINLYFIFKSIFASVAMSLVIIKLNPSELLNVLIVIGICAFVYFVILLLLKGFNKEELVFFRKLLRD